MFGSLVGRRRRWKEKGATRRGYDAENALGWLLVQVGYQRPPLCGPGRRAPIKAWKWRTEKGFLSVGSHNPPSDKSFSDP
jgi:hypothetical protein